MSASEQFLAFGPHRREAATDEQDAFGLHEIKHRRYRFPIELGELSSRHANHFVRRSAWVFEHERDHLLRHHVPR